VSEAAIEAAVTGDPDLALLADLANLDKHSKLNRPPGSGAVPRVSFGSGAVPRVSFQAVQAGSGEGGWRLVMTIQHQGKVLDGLDFARAAVAAWERHLKAWKLA
jgi:hypothetical protein